MCQRAPYPLRSRTSWTSTSRGSCDKIRLGLGEDCEHYVRITWWVLAHAAASRSTSKAARARRLFSFSPPLSPLVPTAAAVDHQLSSPRWMCLASARAPTVSAQPGTPGLWSRSKAVVSSSRDGGSAAVACPLPRHFIGPPEKHRKPKGS
jgi:hypothetical protein